VFTGTLGYEDGIVGGRAHHGFVREEFGTTGEGLS
jgi:hypothetical protein